MHQMLAVQVRVQLQVQVPALEGEVAAAVSEEQAWKQRMAALRARIQAKEAGSGAAPCSG